MEFWVVPNTAGLPTVTAEQIVAEAGGSPHVGKGASVEQNGTGTQVLPQAARTPVDFADNGPALVNYDDLGFYSDSNSTVFTIPDVDPPIERVLLQGTVIFLDAFVTQTPSQSRSIQTTLNGLVTTQVAALYWVELPPVVVSNPTTRLSAATGALAVQAGDVIEFTAAAREPAGNVPIQGFGNLVVIK